MNLHVAKGTLSATVRATTFDTRNTRHGTTSSPRNGGCVRASIEPRAVRLAVVLGNVRVHVVHNIGANGGGEYRWYFHLSFLLLHFEKKKIFVVGVREVEGKIVT